MNHAEEIPLPQGHLLRLSVVICMTVIIICACHEDKRAAMPPPEVQVAEIITKDVPIINEWVGSTDGLVNATIRAQVTGYLITQDYTEGELVKKGSILFRIDPRPFRDALDQAKGVLSQLEAQHENTMATLARVKILASENALSKKDLDDATGAERSAGAAVVAARAAVEKARLDLEFTRLVSPINGIAGIARAQVGDLVGPAQETELTTVSTIDPIKVFYTINEQAYISFMKPFPSRAAGLEAAKKLNIELILADGTPYPYKGTFYAIDRQVDVRTGTLRVAATFPNPRSLLRPGQFVRVRVQRGIQKGALLVPQRAVSEFQGGFQVAVVGSDNRVTVRPVIPGERIDTHWVIEHGLQPGERVIAEGTGKVKEGMLVAPKPFVSSAAADPAASSKMQDRRGAGKR
jgi:membrane fusion protein, multidrug efflux system